MKSNNSWRRRTFLRTVGASIPTAEWVGLAAEVPDAAVSSAKFTPIELSAHFNASSAEFGPHQRARRWADAATARDGLIRPPRGMQALQGVPFLLGRGDVEDKSWVVLSTQSQPWSARTVEIPLGKKAAYVCLAQFCDWDPNETDPADVDVIEQVGQRLGDAVLIYQDGSERAFPIRRRFEVGSPTRYVQVCYCALPSASWAAGSLDAPLADGKDWGEAQMALARRAPSDARIWIWPLENPAPQRTVKALRIDAACQDALVLCGLTLFCGSGNPLQRERLSLYRFTLPSATAEEKGRWRVDADLGVVARTYALPEALEVNAAAAALGDKPKPVTGAIHLYAEVSANPGATLTLRDTKTGANYEFELGELMSGQALEARQRGSRVEIIEREKVWVRGRVVDSGTGRPTPVRLAFRSALGRYIPPYGHRTEINTGFFQDYGADLKLGASSFAYVDGTFQVELPVGEVYVDISKGFEYEPLREKLTISASQRELELRINRQVDLRAKGWVTADTHVHFLSPTTALLEAQAEGLNLVNLLAGQWGDLFTNVGDLSQGPLVSPDKESMVWVGTENRQHLLGHVGLLGGRGEPVFPLSADGPNEGYLGEPLWSTMSEWADACRKREGLAVAVHFPNPLGELPADIVLGKMDAVELYPRGDGAFRSLAYHDWYRYLNCGYRLSAAGGTDKMSATAAVGGNRTYALLAGEEFTFANWAKAVRAGRTFATSGPLLLLEADGRIPGDEIELRAGGATVEIRVNASGYVPFHRLEVVHNGRVVASREESAGTRQMTLAEKLRITGPGWLAARCSSRFGASTASPFGIAAHTSPVYLRIPGQEVFSAPAMTYVLTLLEGARAYVERFAIRPDAQRFAQILKVFDDARAHVQERLHRHGI